MTNSGSHHEEQPFYTLFSGYARHSKPHSLIIPTLKHYTIRIQLEGSAHSMIGDHYESMKPGHLLMLAPGHYYDLKIGYQSPERLEPLNKVHSLDYYMILNGPWVDSWWEQHKPPMLSYHAIDDRMLSIWREITQEQRQSGTSINDIVMHLSFVLFHMLERALAHPILNQSRMSQSAQMMKNFIEQNATESFTVLDVAEHVKLSSSRAAHVFKEAFQQSIMDYVIDLRLNMACERIQHGYMSLEQIAEMCGFQSYSYFHRTFRTRLGLSPSQFRDQRQLKDEA
ncbi:AraC family transcriptional regulator [Paenibacillus marinisediminis]